MRHPVVPVADSDHGTFENMLAGLLLKDLKRAASMAVQAAADTVGKWNWILARGRMDVSSGYTRQIDEMKDGHWHSRCCSDNLRWE